MKKLALVSKKEFEMLKEISDLENEFIVYNINQLTLFNRKNSQLTKLIGIFGEIEAEIISKNSNNLERLIIEYYTNFKSFLDYWETNIKRDFGKKSNEFELFKIATNNEYDNFFDYRFNYELRHYIQHCGFPNIVLKSILNENETIIYSLEINVNDIIDSFDWKKNVRKDLVKKVKIELFNSLRINLECIERIHNVSMNLYDIDDLINCANNVLKYKKHQIDNRELASIVLPIGYPKNFNGKILINIFPFNIAEQILQNTK